MNNDQAHEVLHCPLSWKDFKSPNDYVKFMQDPLRIARLEWRKARRSEHRGLTSHSSLQAILLDGRQLRLEVFADVGLMESIFEGDHCDADSIVYEERIASDREFVRPLTADWLRGIAREVAAHPYSVTENNCHHFVLEIWNKLVIEAKQCSHYPDRVKTGFLWGATESIGQLLANSSAILSGEAFPLVASLASQAQPAVAAYAEKPHRRSGLGSGFSTQIRTSEPSEGKVAGLRKPVRSTFGGGASRPLRSGADDLHHVSITARAEDGNRISGELRSLTYDEYEQASLDCCFAQLAQGDAIHLLRLGDGPLLEARPLPDRACTCASWASSWLQELGEVGVRLAKQIATVYVIDIVERIQPRGVSPDADFGLSSALPFASLSSRTTPASYTEHSRLADICFVVLLGTELRLVIYALMQAGASRHGPWQRLRLLSGDVHSGRENHFTYTLSPVHDVSLTTTAVSLVREELDQLKIALNTGEWGFVTLL